MRATLVLALQGAIGALAYDTFSSVQHPGIVGRSQCGGLLGGCDRTGGNGYAVDPSTVFNLDSGNRYDNSWELCRDHDKCDRPYGKVNYRFIEEELYFEFLEIDDHSYFFEKVEIKLAIGGPPGHDSPMISLDNGKCGWNNDRLGCRADYQSLLDGSAYDNMCPNERDGFFIYIQVRIVVKQGSERYEVYSKSSLEEKFCFSISYHCTSCDECRKHCPDDNCWSDPEWHPDCNDCHKDEYRNHPFCLKQCFKFESDKGLPEPTQKYKKPDPKPEVDCESALVEVYGTSPYQRPLSEHPSCGDHKGVYNSYSYSDLEVSVYGELSLDYNVFASYLVELEKRGADTTILVKVNIENADYFVTEIAIFVQCESGYIGDNSGSSICQPDSYPHKHYDPHGISSFDFEILDEFKCRGNYLFVVFVKVCVAENDCHYCQA